MDTNPDPNPLSLPLSDTPGTKSADSPPALIDPLPPPSQKPSDGAERPPRRHRLLKWLLILVVLIVLLVGGVASWVLYFRHFTFFGSSNREIKVLRAGIFEGNLSEFAPTLGSDEVTEYVNRQIFEGLVTFQEKTKIVPNLASSWVNPDDKTWIFTLKPDVMFHSGNTLTAQDVIYSYQQMKKNTNFPYVTSSIDKVEALGKSQVKITTKNVDPLLLNRLVTLFIVDSQAGGKADPLYGTGPYTTKPGTTPTTNHLELTAFSNFHGGYITTKELQLTVYPQDALQSVIKDFLIGNLNLIGYVPNSVVATAKSLHFQAGSRDDPSVYELGFNIQKKDSPVANLKIRQAIYDTIDVNALLQAVGRGDTGTIAGQVLSPEIPGYNPDITRPSQNLVAARQLVKDAGYPNGAGLTLSVYSAAQDAGQEIARQLGAVGINVKLDVRDDLAKLIDDLSNGKLESFYNAQNTNLLDGSDVINGVAQTANYRNPQITTLLAQADSTLDQTKRLAFLQQASKVLADDVAIVPLYTNRPQWIMDKKYVMPEDTLLSGLGVYIYKVHLP